MRAPPGSPVSSDAKSAPISFEELDEKFAKVSK